jgi:hypothetical protein
MLRKFTTSLARSPWRPLLGALCIALVMLGGILSAAHVHAQGDVEHPECGLCATAHMAIQVTAPAPQIVTVQVYTEVETPTPVARPQFTPQFALFSRPPPADLNRS